MTDPSQRIVFVDDEEDVRLANRQSLELDGFPVEVFPAAEPALKAILAQPPGVVVTDVRLPGHVIHQHLIVPIRRELMPRRLQDLLSSTALGRGHVGRLAHGAPSSGVGCRPACDVCRCFRT